MQWCGERRILLILLFKFVEREYISQYITNIAFKKNPPVDNHPREMISARLSSLYLAHTVVSKT